MWTIILGEPCTGVTSCLRHHHGSLRGAKIEKKIAYTVTAYPCEFLCKASCAASFRKTIFESLQLIRGIQNVRPKLFKLDFGAQSAQASKSWPNTIFHLQVVLPPALSIFNQLDQGSIQLVLVADVAMLLLPCQATSWWGLVGELWSSP